MMNNFKKLLYFLLCVIAAFTSTLYGKSLISPTLKASVKETFSHIRLEPAVEAGRPELGQVHVGLGVKATITSYQGVELYVGYMLGQKMPWDQELGVMDNLPDQFDRESFDTKLMFGATLFSF